MDYNQLIAQTISLCNRNDKAFVDEIPNFITRAIYSIYSKTSTIGFQAIEPGNFNTGENAQFINKPTGWKETISLSYTIPGIQPVQVYVYPRSYEFCRMYSPTITNTGNPVFYADYDLPTTAPEKPGRLFLAPTPAVAYQYELVYLKYPNFNANTEDFIAQRYPRLLLYETAVEAALYLKDDERIATFRSICKEEADTVLANAGRSYTDRTGQRNKD